MSEVADDPQAEIETASDADQTTADSDQSHADDDQTRSDADQQRSDTDQALADRDQDASEHDQHASDRDQAAADWEGSRTGRSASADEAHARSRSERDAATRERGSTAAERSKAASRRLAAADQRDDVAEVRDLTAVIRDRTADSRDRSADARDQAAEARESQAVGGLDADSAVTRHRTMRIFAASIRQRSALERIAAAQDRESAAADRDRAAADRRDAGLDDLTGVFRRGTGEMALTREIERSRRSGRPLVLTIIDVDGLKSVNDQHGHSAGDALLRDVPRAIAATLRSYDITVRWGGDEFVCALSDVSLDVASARLAEIRRTLGELRPGASISAGLAELTDADTLETLVARADDALYRAKMRRDA